MEESIKTETTSQATNIACPSLTDRIKSSVADVVFILFLMSAIAMTMDQFTEVPDWMRAVLMISLFYIYEPLAQTFGCTLGNYIMGIRVRSYAHPNQKLNIVQAYIRFIFKTLLGFISFFTINSNPKRRAMHDMLSGSVVIYAV